MTFKSELIHRPPKGATGARTGGFYRITHVESGASCRIQGNPFSSCGINLLYELGSLYSMPVEELDNFIAFLGEFTDTALRGVEWKARRYLIQPNGHPCGFVKALLERCEKLTSYENLAHPSSTQYLYMLAIPEKKP